MRQLRAALENVYVIALGQIVSYVPLYTAVLYQNKIRRRNNSEGVAVLEYHAIHSSTVNESDCCVILEAGE